MSSEPSTAVLDRPRLNLKPESSAAGSVDGAWWPGSRDLPAELPAVMAELANRIGPVERVAYNLDAWAAVPRKISINGETVRMAGFHSLDRDTVHMIGARRRLVLTVVPPDADEQTAAAALTAAGQVPTTKGSRS